MRRVLKNKKGYTLTELIVVMGIIGLLLLITFGGYASIRKDKYIQHVANLTQTEIRDTFIDIISTRVWAGSSEDPCNGAAPQIGVIKISLSDALLPNPVNKFSFCEDSSGTLVKSDPEVPVDFSSGINYKDDIKISAKKKWDHDSTGHSIPDETLSSGFLYLIFVSPYGEYHSYYSSSDDLTTNRWSKDLTDLIYKPSSALNFDRKYFELSFNTDSGDMNKSRLYVDEGGNVELVFMGD